MNRPEILPRAPRPRAPRAPFIAGIGELGQQAIPTLASYVRMIRARKWLVVGITLLSIIAAVIVGEAMTPIFRATATLMVESSKAQVVSIQDLYAGSITGNREAIQTQSEYIRSRHVARRVMTELNLDTNPLFEQHEARGQRWKEWLLSVPLLGTYLQRSSAPATGSTAETKSAETVAESTGFPKRVGSQGQLEDPLVSSLLGGISAETSPSAKRISAASLSKFESSLEVSPIRQSQLIEIRFESEDPVLASTVANTVAMAYIRSDLDARFNMQKAAATWLSGRLDELKLSLEKSEESLQVYREKAGIISTPGPGLGGNVKQLETTVDRLVLARVARAQAEQIYRQVRPGAPNRMQVPSVFNNPAVAAARQAEAVARQVLTERTQSLGTAHPLYREALTQFEAATENTRRQSEAVISSLAKEYEVARSTELAIERELSDSKSNIRDLNRSFGELHLLEREVETNRKLYETFLSRVKEANATSDFLTPVARVVDPADPPISPVKPRKLVIILLAAFLGCVTSSAVAIGLEIRSAVVRSVADIEESLEANLLVAVPQAKRSQLAVLHRIQHDDSRSLIAEAVRTALTDIRLVTHELACPVVAFTSAIGGEGKSTIAANFAIEVARKKSVLLIDADLRKPSIGNRMGLKPDVPGLADLLHGKAPLNDCLHSIREFGLSVMPAGNFRENPLDLLMGEGFRDHMDTLRGLYEMIVIDTPPIELVSDVLPIGLQSSGIVFVVKANSTPLPIAKRALSRVIAADIPVFGVILNAHDFARASKYYGEYAAHSKYGYYAPAEEVRVHR